MDTPEATGTAQDGSGRVRKRFLALRNGDADGRDGRKGPGRARKGQEGPGSASSLLKYMDTPEATGTAQDGSGRVRKRFLALRNGDADGRDGRKGPGRARKGQEALPPC